MPMVKLPGKSQIVITLSRITIFSPKSKQKNYQLCKKRKRGGDDTSTQLAKIYALETSISDMEYQQGLGGDE